jgi:hypothetical protein
MKVVSEADKRATVIHFGWQPTAYGTFIPPDKPWYTQPQTLEYAYARVMGLPTPKPKKYMSREQIHQRVAEYVEVARQVGPLGPGPKNYQALLDAISTLNNALKDSMFC